MVERRSEEPRRCQFESDHYHMSKLEKKREKLKERITTLESELLDALTKKTSNVREINVPEQTRKISEAKAELIKLK